MSVACPQMEGWWGWTGGRYLELQNGRCGNGELQAKVHATDASKWAARAQNTFISY